MGNIKDLLNGEPFTARIVDGMVEVWLRHTERLCHFYCVMELFAISAEIFEIKISLLNFFNIFNPFLQNFSVGGLIFLLFSANVFIPVQMSMKREFQKSWDQMHFPCPVVSERRNFQSSLSNRDLTSGE